MRQHFCLVFLVVCSGASAEETFVVSEEYLAENEPLTNNGASVFVRGIAAPMSRPFPLDPGPHLFIDDFLIAEMRNVRRIMNTPQRDAAIPNPVVTGKDDGNFQPYLSVMRDEATGGFRLWYGHRTDDMQTARQRLGYMESGDGIHWQRPPSVLDVPGEMQFGVSVISAGPLRSNPAQQYQLGFYSPDGGLKIGVSPDGLSWSFLNDDVAVRHNHDINGIFYDTARKRYIATVSAYRTGDDWDGERRITMQSYSKDLVHWSPAHYVILPDPAHDEGETQFYAMDGYLMRGDLIVGMVKVLRDDLKADDPPNPPEAYGVGYTALAWSRDGQHWTRDTAPFFSRDPSPDAWDHAHAWIDEQVAVGDDVYLYYGGYAHGHKVGRFEERQIGLVTIKQDRYAGWTAANGEGELITPPLLLNSTALSVNVDATEGRLVAELRDGDGRPFRGFRYKDCRAVSGDHVSVELKWDKPLARLEGKQAVLAFRLEKATLYALYAQNQK